MEHSRRNTKSKFTARNPILLGTVNEYINQRALSWRSVPQRVGVMLMGVSINGRPWPKGSCCRFTRDYVGSGATIHTGVIKEYYSFYGEHKGPVFVKVQKLNVVSSRGVMFVVDAHSISTHVVHIDNLLFLYHLAPHYNDNAALKCCLPVATAHPLALDVMD